MSFNVFEGDLLTQLNPMETSTVKQRVIQAKKNYIEENLIEYRLHRVKEDGKTSLLNKQSKKATPHLP